TFHRFGSLIGSSSSLGVQVENRACASSEPGTSRIVDQLSSALISDWVSRLSTQSKSASLAANPNPRRPGSRDCDVPRRIDSTKRLSESVAPASRGSRDRATSRGGEPASVGDDDDIGREDVEEALQIAV